MVRGQSTYFRLAHLYLSALPTIAVSRSPPAVPPPRSTAHEARRTDGADPRPTPVRFPSRRPPFPARGERALTLLAGAAARSAVPLRHGTTETRFNPPPAARRASPGRVGAGARRHRRRLTAPGGARGAGNFRLSRAQSEPKSHPRHSTHEIRYFEEARRRRLGGGGAGVAHRSPPGPGTVLRSSRGSLSTPWLGDPPGGSGETLRPLGG